MSNDRPSRQQQRGTALPVLPLIAAVGLGLAFIGMMLAMMAWMGGGQMGMMRSGSSGADQTPVVSDEQRVTVEMRDYEFFPAKLTVDEGTEVTWVNRDSVPHNAVGEAFDSGKLNSGEGASIVLDEPGIHFYVCTYHPGMEATITVR
ncbi:MAG: cupredoxin domain-containing protein [Chloroflexi bacterium]|nr:cupredoxin domain-containing protein [Chloroflexota bacterium]